MTFRSFFYYLMFLLPLLTAPYSAYENLHEERLSPPLTTSFEVVDAFKKPPTRYASGHRGIDLKAAVFEEVLAPAAGTVHFNGVVVDRPLISILISEQTILTIEPVLSELKEGQQIMKGDVIGRVATGAHCSQKCIHLGIRVAGEYVNPMFFFGVKPTLLPL